MRKEIHDLRRDNNRNHGEGIEVVRSLPAGIKGAVDHNLEHSRATRVASERGSAKGAKYKQLKTGRL